VGRLLEDAEVVFHRSQDFLDRITDAAASLEGALLYRGLLVGSCLWLSLGPGADSDTLVQGKP